MIAFLTLLLLTSTPDSLNQIGLKVWQNECRGTLDGLTTWSAGESFASLGIGHFIWYPKKAEATFQETFPTFLAYLQEREVEIPSWMLKGCPWKTKQEFDQAKRSKKMLQLRNLLSSTLDHQIAFLFTRFEEAEKVLSPHLTDLEKKHLATLKKTDQGIYALIDYVNFKGIGLSPKERYRGQGWGLLQVLQNIPADTPDSALVSAFSTSALKVLKMRVRNAPASRNEQRWIKGWQARLETYHKAKL